MPDIAEILDRAKPREARVPVCLAGDLAGEVDRLQAELAQFGDGWTPQSMGDVDPRLDLVRQIEAAREGMREASVEFRLVALGHTAYSNLIADHPAPEGRQEPYDPATFLPALLAACCTDPVMTAVQARDLLDLLNDGQAQALFAAALAVNEEPSPLPF
jgi:hypothetical protein